ncbi:hypothetical protein PRIPAC_96955 [Pristionchus pacificus]|uniref:glutathione transferase n=1 Tax=Pristionchus pacificus TaxID=54126 RepID=A0A2A6D2V3_PRIPA|nr:hypothetical protein PRIPAC_96955 [Pristionchus pacificus]|eukprot:PDM84611.1 Glutathione S-transferase [Pristionchus pacificus]
MSLYKLTYFDMRGRAEVARQILHLAGVPFEDVRLSEEKWAGLKNKTPYGQLPILEFRGKVLAQSNAINRYLANEFGFVGKSAFDKAYIDSLADQFKDYLNKVEPALWVLLEYEKGDSAKVVKEIAIPERDKLFPILEKIAKAKSKNGGYFVGDSLTWVDLLIADTLTTLLGCMPGHLDGFPTVLNTVNNINAIPELKKWIKKRADSTY